MKLTLHRMVGWRTSCLRGLVVIFGLMAAAAVASAQESKPVEKAGTTTKPRDTSKGPNLDVPAKRVADPKMPDISGTWQIGKQGEFGEAVIRRIEGASDDFACQARGDKNGRDQRLKWSPEAQRFEVTNIDPKPNRSAGITLQVFPNGKTMRVVYEVDEQAKQELQKATEFFDSQLNAFLDQEWTRTKKPEGKAAKSANASADSAKPAPANSDAVADAKMPDISGTWRVKFESPNVTATPIPEMEIRKVQNGATDFLIDQPWVESAKRVSVRWSATRMQFEGAWEVDGNDSRITLRPLEDGETMRVVISNKLPPTKETHSDGKVKTRQSETFSTQDWTRTSLALSTTFPAKHYGLSETSNTSTTDGRPSDITTNLHALPDTPAAKQLVEQLGAQESAAAAEAATIRQLQANGQAEQDQQLIAGHQRELKHLLSTAFDLKLQLEELQVRELQSRLSRLERQIGQRRGLREQIIDRRANELVLKDALRWTPDVSTNKPEASITPRNSETQWATTSEPTSNADQIVVDLYGGSRVLPNLNKNAGYSKLVQTLNALKGVRTNVREAGAGDTIVIAFVRDPYQVCRRETQRTQQESELRIAINAALTAAGIEAVRWDERSVAEETSVETSANFGTQRKSGNFADGKSIDELLDVLQDDRDMMHVIAVLLRLGKSDLGEHPERAATLILAAMEFFDTHNSQPTTNVPPSYFAIEALKSISRTAKLPALVTALRDGHPRVKQVAIWSFYNDSSFWEYANEPEFAALAEQILAVAAGPDELPRASALAVLAQTLPITSIDLAELVTGERREAVQRLATAIPHDRVLQLITGALSESQIEVAITSARLLSDMPDKMRDPDLLARVVDLFSKVTQGKLQGVAASRWQRGQATDGLAKLREEAAPAVPMLIELLESDDPDFKIDKHAPQGSPTYFSRDKVIVTLGAIGPAAKDALPILEAELAILDAKAKVNALLSSDTQSSLRAGREGTAASRLRTAITKIKGESRDNVFRRPGS